MPAGLLLFRRAFLVLIQRFATFWTETELASLRSRAARGLANTYLCAGLLIFGEARDSSSSTSRVGAPTSPDLAVASHAKNGAKATSRAVRLQ